MDKYIGILSGTSLDSIDVASYKVTDKDITSIATSEHVLSPQIKKLCRELRYNNLTTILEIAKLDISIGLDFAKAINTHLQDHHLDAQEFRAIGSHGINIFHQPAPHAITVQLGDPNVIAEKTNITVVGDFRRRDVAASGQGAPLAPLFHQEIFSSSTKHRCIINIGGICNISLLQHNKSTLGFDLGPGNCLIDEICLNKFACEFDKDAEFAKKGKCDHNLLDILLDDPYFKMPAPKSTGREYFNSEWLSEKLANYNNISKHDLLNTLTNLTAHLITQFIQSLDINVEIYLCGGGANNPMFHDIISTKLAQEVYTTEKLGVHHDWVESALFAWLAKNTINSTSLDYSKVTGSKGARILGGIFQS
ncbi:MAG: anhydro-N-acetylmuramic acid kinase [Francisellaceae bacterium]|nr:anhydro-N-acetylmuramic acid kinase [Francisellaceae bacterium]